MNSSAALNVLSFFLLFSIATPVLVFAETPSVRTEHPVRGSFEFLPMQDIFQPLVADVRESQFSMRYEYQHWEMESFNAAVASFGDYLPVINYYFDPESTLQFSIDGAFYGIFNLDTDSFDLINTDYIFGLSASLGVHNFSSRLRLGHVSGHLGDEFLIANPELERRNSSYEDVSLVLGYQLRSLRFYAGSGYIFRANRESELRPWSSRSGVEFRKPFGGSEINLLVALDVELVQRSNWRLSRSVLAGLVLLQSEARELRFMSGYFAGGSPHGQFFNERLEYYGVGFYFLV